MKRFINSVLPLFAFIVACSAVIIACDKNDLNLSKNVVMSDGAFFKLGWFSPGLTSQGVQLKVNGERVSNQLGLGFTSTTNYAMPFPGGGLNTGGNNKNDYLNLVPGSNVISLTIPKKGTNIDSVEIITETLNLEKGMYYTWIVTDSFPNAKSYLLTDSASYADSGFIKLKFTNAIPNIPAEGVDFFVTNAGGTNQLLAKNVQFKTATEFINVPYVSGTNTFTIRRKDSTANLATYATSGLTNKRVYTVVARGYFGVTGTRAPAISFIFNK